MPDGTVVANRLDMLGSILSRALKCSGKLLPASPSAAFVRKGSVPRSNTVIWALSPLVSPLLLPLACSNDSCREGERRCQDNVAQVCRSMFEDDMAWVSEDCGAGYCQLSTDP